METPWTPERDALIASMRAAGKKTGEIAAALGMTRNQVLGRAHRLELERKASPISDAALAAAAARRAEAKQLGHALGVSLTRKTWQPKNYPPPTKCQWMEGESREHCGAAVVKGAYCAAHAARAYLPPRPFTPRVRRR